MTWANLRIGRGFVTRNPLVTAFVLSLAVHFALYSGWKVGKRLGWWDHQATWLLEWKKKLHPQALRPAFEQAAVQPAQREVPLTFVEVDASVATPTPPKDAKYYGAQSTRAANPEPVLDSVVPKAEGEQTKVVRLENVPKPSPQPLQPAAPPEKTPEPIEAKPKGGENPGDMAKAKPAEIKKPNDGHVETTLGETPVIPHEKPRTLAAARQQKAMLAGEKMKQEGGTPERGKFALAVAKTPYGSYDSALIAAVQQRWYDLLDNTRFSQRSGKVVVEFRLYYDGRITDMKADGNEVGEMLGLLCQRAVIDPSPFAPWPSDMRRAIGKNYRDVMFTFYYN